jgi:hypothetical protein
MAANPKSALSRRSAQKVDSKPVSEPTSATRSVLTRVVLPPEHQDSPAVAPDIIATEVGYESHHEATARAAYFLAEARGFEPGHDVDDWFAAEQQLGLR